MAEGVQRRSCHRFEIPGATAEYKKAGLLAFVTGLSKAYPVANVSKGGVAFLCEEPFSKGQKLTVQLLAPQEVPLKLHAEVRWQGRHQETGGAIVGVAFAPFGPKMGQNSLEDLDVLRRFDEKYRKGKEASERGESGQ